MAQESGPGPQQDFWRRLAERREETRELLSWVGSIGALVTGLGALLAACIFGCTGLALAERSWLTIAAGLSLVAAALAFSILFIATRPK
jgi:hypothetical protein